MTDRQTPVMLERLKGAKPNLEVREIEDLVQSAESYYEEQWNLMKVDTQNYSGYQIDERILADRDAKNRPTIIANILSRTVDHIHGRMDEDDYSVSVVPVDFEGEDLSGKKEFPFVSLDEDPQGFTRPQVLEGILRHIFEDSKFKQQRSDASLNALVCGLGYLRVFTDYENGNSANKTFRIKSIAEPMDVVMDPCTEEADGSDANWVAISKWIPEAEARRQYPKANIGGMNFSRLVSSRSRGIWNRANQVRVMEFIRCYEKEEMNVFLSNNKRMLEKDYNEVKDDLAEQGVQAVSKRVFYSRYYWMWTVVDGEIVKGPKLLPYRCMPVVPIYGRKRWYDRDPIYHSLIRDAEGIQQAVNWMLTSLVEQGQKASHNQWMGDPRAIMGLGREWAEQLNDPNGFLPINTVHEGSPVPPPVRPPPLRADPITMQTLETMTSLFPMVIGMDEGAFGYSSNSTSARSTQIRINTQQLGVKDFFTHLQSAVEAVGKVILSGIPEVFGKERIVSVMTDEGEIAHVPVNSNWITDRATGKDILMNPLGGGEVNVTVRVVPGSITQKEETVRILNEMVKGLPESQSVVIDEIIGQLDIPIAQKAKTRLQSVLPLTALNAKEREEWLERQKAAYATQLKFDAAKLLMDQQAQQQIGEYGIQPPPPSPDQVAAQAKAQKAQADAEKAGIQAQGAAAAVENSQRQADRADKQMQLNLTEKVLDIQTKQREMEKSMEDKIQDAVNKAVLAQEDDKEQE